MAFPALNCGSKFITEQENWVIVSFPTTYMLAGSLLVKIAHPWDENWTHLRTSRYQDDLELRARTYRMETKYCLVVEYNIRAVW